MLPMAESRRDRNRQADPPGTAPRRTALRLLDAVLRRGEPLDIAAHAATQGLAPADRAFAIAIVSEAMRWMVDIDALIDGATSEILPEDVKATRRDCADADRKSEALGTSVVVRVDIGGRSIIKNENRKHNRKGSTLLEIYDNDE